MFKVIDVTGATQMWPEAEPGLKPRFLTPKPGLLPLYHT